MAPVPRMWLWICIDWSLKVYTQLAREGGMLTQDGDTELSLVLSSRRVAARGDSCKEAIGEINLPFLPLNVPAECPLIPYTQIPHRYVELPHIKCILTVVFMRTTNIPRPRYTRRTY